MKNWQSEETSNKLSIDKINQQNRPLVKEMNGRVNEETYKLIHGGSTHVLISKSKQKIEVD